VSFVIVMLIMLAFMYLLLIRPQRNQQRRHKDLLDNLKVGDEVITAGGIYGDVVGVEDEKVHVLIAEDVEIEVARRSIASVVPPEVEPGPADDAPVAEVDSPAAEVLGDPELEEAGQARGAQPRRQD
jgi:preprotein translocase subunit YajC